MNEGRFFQTSDNFARSVSDEALPEKEKIIEHKDLLEETDHIRGGRLSTEAKKFVRDYYENIAPQGRSWPEILEECEAKKKELTFDPHYKEEFLADHFKATLLGLPQLLQNEKKMHHLHEKRRKYLREKWRKPLTEPSESKEGLNKSEMESYKKAFKLSAEWQGHALRMATVAIDQDAYLEEIFGIAPANEIVRLQGCMPESGYGRAVRPDEDIEKTATLLWSGVVAPAHLAYFLSKEHGSKVRLASSEMDVFGATDLIATTQGNSGTQALFIQVKGAVDRSLRNGKCNFMLMPSHKVADYHAQDGEQTPADRHAYNDISFRQNKLIKELISQDEHWADLDIYPVTCYCSRDHRLFQGGRGEYSYDVFS